MPDRIYLDYNATAPLLSCAREQMISMLGDATNASSVHFEGRAARKAVEAARLSFSELISANPANIVFTSGATEAAMHALYPVVRIGGKEQSVSRLYVSATEHPCMLSGGRFNQDQIAILPGLESGRIDLEALAEALKHHDRAEGIPMVAVQYANNETGVVQPVTDIAEIVHAHDGLLVVDAVQALGKVEVNVAETAADLLVFSSHKIGGPQGVGAIVLGNGCVSPVPMLRGGGQESFHRAGTENVAAIAGFGAACDWHKENLTKNIQIIGLRDSIEEGLSTISLKAGNGISQPVFFGKSEERLGNTSCFSVPGVTAETALVALDLEGISVSSGSACSSGKVKQSHVLEAMGAKPEEMAGALRVSLGWNSREEDADRFLDVWKTVVSRIAA